MAKTIYCAQAFWRRDGQLRGGEVHQFLDADRAREGGAILAGSADGVAVFSLTGEPDVDYWGEPVILAMFGEAPSHNAFDQRAA